MHQLWYTIAVNGGRKGRKERGEFRMFITPTSIMESSWYSRYSKADICIGFCICLSNCRHQSQSLTLIIDHYLSDLESVSHPQMSTWKTTTRWNHSSIFVSSDTSWAMAKYFMQTLECGSPSSVRLLTWNGYSSATVDHQMKIWMQEPNQTTNPGTSSDSVPAQPTLLQLYDFKRFKC